MHFKGLDLNLLVALDALLSEKNVTRAAERVHVSQPAMSASLQKLRLHLADPLLERVGRGLELTPRGHMLAGPLKDLLDRARILLSLEPDFDPRTTTRTFRIAMTSYCAEVLGVRLVQQLGRIAPNISCQLDELTTDAVTRIYEGDVDFCIALSRYVIADPNFVQDRSCEQLLFTDQFALVGASENPIFNNPIDYAVLCRQPYVEVRLDRSVFSIVEQALRHRPQRPAIKAWVPSFHQALSMVSKTAMVAIVPARLVALHGDYFGLRAVRAPLPLQELDETAFWHPRNDADPGHSWMRDILIEVSATLPGLQTSDTTRAPFSHAAVGAESPFSQNKQ